MKFLFISFVFPTFLAYSLNVSKKLSVQIFVSIGMTLSVYLYTYYSATLITYFVSDSDIIRNFDDIFDYKFSLYAHPSVNSTLLQVAQHEVLRTY